VGWFAIACLAGFLGYWQWLRMAGRLAVRRHRQIDINDARVLVAYRLLGALVAVLILWAVLGRGALTWGDIIDNLGDGKVARTLLGLALGFGAGFVTAQTPPPPPSASSDHEQPKKPSGIGGLPTHFVLSTGLGIAVLALAAPHLVRWLSRLSSV
jgi:hypothetical protein